MVRHRCPYLERWAHDDVTDAIKADDGKAGGLPSAATFDKSQLRETLSCCHTKSANNLLAHRAW